MFTWNENGCPFCGRMDIYGPHYYIFSIPKIIEPDFPNLIEFKAKIKKLLIFS